MHVEQSLYVFAGRHVASCSSAGRVRRLAWQGAWQQAGFSHPRRTALSNATPSAVLLLLIPDML